MPMGFTQDFDGHFKMNVPLGKHYTDCAWCGGNGALGSICEYCSDDMEYPMGEDDIIIYYYNNSQLSDGESNAWQHSLDVLTTSYLYDIYSDDGNLIILTNEVTMNKMPPILVGKTDDDGSNVVFVGGFHLDELKKYADSIQFN